MGGAVNNETYDNLIRRLNNQAIAYLAIEQITSASAKATPPSVAPADLGPLTTAVTTAKTNLAAAQDILAADKKKAAALDPTKDADALKTLDSKITDDNTDITNKQTALNDASTKLADALKPSATNAGATTTPADVTAATIAAAKEIALDIVNADYSPSMCFAHEIHKVAPSTSAELDTYCKAVLDNQAASAKRLQDAQIDAISARNEFTTKLAAAIATNCVQTDDKSRAACAKLLTAAGTQSNPGNANPVPQGPAQLMQDIQRPQAVR
jgi:hypothetical protein